MTGQERVLPRAEPAAHQHREEAPRRLAAEGERLGRGQVLRERVWWPGALQLLLLLGCGGATRQDFNAWEAGKWPPGGAASGLQQQCSVHEPQCEGCNDSSSSATGLCSAPARAAPVRGYDGPIPTPEQLFDNVTAMAEACASRPHQHMVLTLACFSNADSVIAFVRSWRMHSPATHVVLMTDNRAIYDRLHLPPRVRVVLIKKFATMPWWSWRMWGFLEFLEECGRRNALPKGLVVSDSRDAIALGNVWMHPLAAHAVAQNLTIFSMGASLGWWGCGWGVGPRGGRSPAWPWAGARQLPLPLLSAGHQAQLPPATRLPALSLRSRRTARAENQVGPGGRPQPLLIKDEPWDRDMMHKCFDGLQPPELVDHLLNRPLTCAGAMLGSGPAVLEYFRSLMDVSWRWGLGRERWLWQAGAEFEVRTKLWAPPPNRCVAAQVVMHEASSKCVLIADQGAHNWLLHVTGGKKSKLNFGAMELFNGHSWLYTASVAMPIQVDKFGVISVHREGWSMHPLYIHK